MRGVLASAGPSFPKPGRRPSSNETDSGAALIVALLLTALMAALGVGLVELANTERSIAANFRTSQQARYAADAAVERSLVDLRPLTDWNGVLAGSTVSSFRDTTLTPTLASGQPLDIAAETAVHQRVSDARHALGANDPVWRLFAYGPLDALLPSGPPSSAYVVVWVADDRTEIDGNPAADSNGVVLLTARAWVGRAVHTVEAALAKPPTGAAGVHVLAWRSVF